MTSIKSSTVASQRNWTSHEFILYSCNTALISSWSILVNGTVLVILIPPFSFFLSKMSGGDWFKRIPKPSSSLSMIFLCCKGLFTSNTMKMRSQDRATAITCLPLPRPSLAPSMIPGRSSIWILAPLYLITPGTVVSVVNSYAAASECVPVSFDSKVLLPTDGNPMNPMVSPVFLTSNPGPPPPPPELASFSSSFFNLASLAFSIPKCFSVALFFCVLAISSSMALIFSTVVMMNKDDKS
ncbi:hypothetical protein OGATHE_006097 [Ogataea polymorpha]|uniref:Transmembrane protein n=1 Tax=Ogataea polymorpha TaxID=460523 RepID=A0A9P8NQY3_9ASCO|nr:hypothetical protein OGATHE_006097 [Ogataea polymorpha]